MTLANTHSHHNARPGMMTKETLTEVLHLLRGGRHPCKTFSRLN